MSDVESVEGVTTEDQPAEVQNTEEADNSASAETENTDEGVEAPQETVEEKLARLERENAGLNKAISRKTAAAHKANEVLQREQKEKAELLEKLKASQTENVAPKVDDFESYEDYVDALSDYKAKEKINLERQEQVKREQAMLHQKSMQERLATRQSQEKEYRESNPLYDNSAKEVNEYVQQATQLGEVKEATANAIVDQLYTGDVPVPAVIDYFGKNGGENIDELARISKLSAPQAAVEIYKIQQALKAVPAQKKEQKQVPKPIKTASGAGGSKKGLGSHSSGDDVLKHFGLK